MTATTSTAETQSSQTGSIRQALPSPATLRERLPVSTALANQIASQRDSVRRIIQGEDPRLLVIAGPCSIHDPQAALEYGHRLADLSEQVSDKMLLVMRCYVEKPRTTVGWKGLLYDPHLDGSNDMATGLTVSRHLMLDLAKLGLPVATELLHPMAADYLGDLLSWAAIGARTTESQVHRETVSGLELPVGFKNGTDGGIGVVSDAMAAARHPHSHLGIDEHGQAAMIRTQGNPDTHLVLRGGRQGPNYDEAAVSAAIAALESKGLNPHLLVDCSHANSGKDPRRQPQVMASVLRQRQAGQRALVGVMLESHLQEGNQPLAKPLRHGVSITDACLGWKDSEALIRSVL